jgi:transposase-like protein
VSKEISRLKNNFILPVTIDEVFLKINGVTHYLWRAVDQHGVVLDILVQPKRDRFTAHPFLSPAVAGHRASASAR